MKTLLLDQTQWDLVLDAAGNIAVATDPYALAQDVASAVRLFLGELWYDSAQGVPYFQDVFGQAPPLSFFQQLVEKAAATVPGVSNPRCIITQVQGRTVSGTVTFTDANGNDTAVALL